MGQIIGGAAKPKRCNINQLSQLGTPAAGEYILVSFDNSMNAAGQGNFDCYIVGDGTTAATALELKYINEEAEEIHELLGYSTPDLVDLSKFTARKAYSEDFEEVGASTAAHSNDILIEGAEYLTYTISAGTATSAETRRYFFIDGNRQLIGTFALRYYQVGTYRIDVPDGAVYFVFNCAQTYLTNHNMPISVFAYYSGTIDTLTGSISENTKKISEINTGYGNLLRFNWVRGGWYYYNSFRTDLYKNRAAIPEIIHFDEDVVLTLKNGFSFQLIARDADDVGFTASGCTCKIPAGSNVCLGVRRIKLIDGEVLTDEQVQEFASAVMVVSQRGSDRELVKDTFFGIEMFDSMAIIGDSYSAGSNGNSWGKCLGRMIGTNITVWAQSGWDSADWITNKLNTLLASDPMGLYWINLGINDGSRAVSEPSYIGSRADLDEETYQNLNFPDTFYGNMGKIIRNIQVHAPRAKIILEKTLFASMANAQQNLPTTLTLDINNAIADIADYYGIPCVDQLDDPFYTSPEYRASMISNHPRTYAWVGMANANRRLFTKAVFNNPEYFY